MGGSQSTRKLQVDNDHPATVITVSERVVQRIRSGAEKESVDDFQQEPKKVRSLKRSDLGSNIESLHDGVPFVTARMIREELENELDKNNHYWQTRVIALQEHHEKVNKIIEEEYMKSVEQIKKELPKLPPENSTPPCQDLKGSILKCYKMNTKRPLLCAQEVEAFNSCIRDSRLKVISLN